MLTSFASEAKNNHELYLAEIIYCTCKHIFFEFLAEAKLIRGALLKGIFKSLLYTFYINLW